MKKMSEESVFTQKNYLFPNIYNYFTHKSTQVLQNCDQLNFSLQLFPRDPLLSFQSPLETSWPKLIFGKNTPLNNNRKITWKSLATSCHINEWLILKKQLWNLAGYSVPCRCTETQPRWLSWPVIRKGYRGTDWLNSTVFCFGFPTSPPNCLYVLLQALSHWLQRGRWQH